MNRLLEDKVAVVTGASGEIGRAVALEMACEGAHVVVNYHRNVQSAEEIAKEIEALGREAVVVQASLTNPEDVNRLMKTAKDTLGKIDVLVNNAGIMKDTFLLMMKDETWNEVIDVNLNSVYFCCKSVLKVMITQKSGNIVNVSSLSGVTGRIGQTNYAASKGGVIAFTKSLAQEVGRKGIRVNAVAPGLIDTELIRKIPDGLLDLKAIPLYRLGQPEEVAKGVLFLASDLSSYITGTVLHINGGLYM